MGLDNSRNVRSLPCYLNILLKALFASILAATFTSSASAKPNRIDIPFRETSRGYCNEFTEYGAWQELPGQRICFSNIKASGPNTIIYQWDWYSPHAGHSEENFDDGIYYSADCKNNKYGMLKDDGSLWFPDLLGADEVELCQYALSKGLISESIKESTAYTYKSSAELKDDDGACVKGPYEVTTTWDTSTLDYSDLKINEAILCYFGVEVIDNSLVYLAETSSTYRPYRKNKWIKNEFVEELIVDCGTGTYTTGENVIERIDQWWKFNDKPSSDGFTRPFFQDFCDVLMSGDKPDIQLSNTQPRSSLPEAEAPPLAANGGRTKPELYQTLDDTPFYWRIK